MSALKGRQVTDFLKKRPADNFAVLIYGPDSGVVRDRSDQLAKQVVADFHDPFNFLEISDTELKAEPSRLVDEAAALSFAGGERVVRLRTTGDAAAGPAKTLISWLDAGEVQPNALIIIEAGDLTKRSALRKAFEGAKRAAALPCYTDAPENVRALVEASLREENLLIDDDAAAVLLGAIGTDRGVARAELEKLIVYMGPKTIREGEARITRADVEACLVEASGAALDELTSAAADGRTSDLADAMQSYGAAGGSAIGALRALQRAFNRLYTAQKLISGGMQAKAAMMKLRPPVFFAEERAFQARLRRLPVARLEQGLRILVEAELAAKTTGAPQDEIVERAALRLSRLAR